MARPEPLEVREKTRSPSTETTLRGRTVIELLEPNVMVARDFEPTADGERMTREMMHYRVGGDEVSTGSER